MDERQRKLIMRTRRYLNELIACDDNQTISYLSAKIAYRNSICELARDFPDIHTLSLGIEVMHKLFLCFRQYDEKKSWLYSVEEDTVLALMFDESFDTM